MSLFLSNSRRFYSKYQKVCSRCFSVSLHRSGLEEFFPPGVYDGNNYVEEEPISGRPWKVSELRIRSNTDLHKLWYVLLKEKNMLLTLDHECKRLGIPVPGPTRLNKVERSMDKVEIVIKEREKAILDLEKQRKYKFDGDNFDTDSATDNLDSTDKQESDGSSNVTQVHL